MLKPMLQVPKLSTQNSVHQFWMVYLFKRIYRLCPRSVVQEIVHGLTTLHLGFAQVSRISHQVYTIIHATSHLSRKYSSPQAYQIQDTHASTTPFPKLKLARRALLTSRV